MAAAAGSAGRSPQAASISTGSTSRLSLIRPSPRRNRGSLTVRGEQDAYANAPDGPVGALAPRQVRWASALRGGVMLLQSRPARLVVALAMRGLQCLACRPDDRARFEHEGHGVADDVGL